MNRKFYKNDLRSEVNFLDPQMMMLFKTLEKKINDCVKELAKDQRIENIPGISLDLSQDYPLHGEVSTNGAMILAKAFRKAPKVLAEIFKQEFQTKIPFIQNIEIAGPGFLNITLKSEVWLDEMKNILLKKDLYSQRKENTEKILVEFVSANPTGPMHAGHVRNAVLGDVMVALLRKMGHQVFKEYYINDAGNQVAHLGESVYLRYQEIFGKKLSDHAFDGDLYPGDYLIPIAQSMVNHDGSKWLNTEKTTWLPVFKDFAVKAMMDIIRKDLASLGVVMDFFTSERVLTQEGKVEQALSVLQKQDDIYEGVLNPPKGIEVDDWEERPQTLFRSTKYGDDIDRALKKSDNSWTYFAADIAYHLDKVQRGFLHLIDVLGADHCGYVKRITAATRAISQGKAKLSVRVFQLVNFFENGQPVKMSKRAGTFISAHDIVSRVGKEATRFMMISKNSNTIIDFDFQKVLEQSQENPLFYIQYAHARIMSVFAKAKELFPDATETALCDSLENLNLTFINHSEEIGIIRKLAFWPEVVQQAAKQLEPHRVATFLYDLAGEFHKLWNLGKSSLFLRFIEKDNVDITKAKLAFLLCIAIVLRDGLQIIGIQPTNHM